MRRSILFATMALAAAGVPALSAQVVDAKATFDKTVKPMLQKSCSPCHNDRNASGSLNLQPFGDFQSLAGLRDGWERIVHKVQTGEMPPKGIPRPPEADVAAMMKLIHAEFERQDKLVKPDPGRVTARRLNRSEYTNTIRDLLAVDFRADRDFPTDDSGHGFDNIGDVLTVSPILMEKYLRAAERISAQAIGANPLPKKPVDIEFHSKDKQILRIDRSTIQANHRVEWDGEYVIRIGMPGERNKDALPVKLGFWMDGQLLATQTVETKPSGLVYFNPYSEAEFKLVIPSGDHVFRAGFIDDPFVKALSDKDAYSDKKNKFLNMIKFLGPFPAKVEKASRKKILICDPASGAVCVNKILATLARNAYRRPVSAAEVSALAKFVTLAKAEGQTAEQGIQVAIQAMLVSPHFLFRVERDAFPNDPGRVYRVADLELASRLSYFVWSSMPDNELLTLAETGRLRQPGVIDAQVKRMLADARAASLADNFAGQWLETRNLDSVKPDPGKFPEWGPELRDAMKTETRLFFEHMLRENRPMVEFIDANYTFLNERLARHYGIEGITGGDFRRVDLTTNQRGGVLGQAGVLTVSSYPTRTSPVIRGKYILQNVLGAPPPPPPPDVPPLDDAGVGETGSLRQGLEKHRSNAVCASCHDRMDTLGFGLENYDAIGRWRTKDGKFDIDVSGSFPGGKSFSTPAEMRSLLRGNLPEFSRCLTEKMMTYALGRGLERYDRKTLETIQTKLAANGYPFQTMVYEIARSLPFQFRRGEVSQNTNQNKPKETAQR